MIFMTWQTVTQIPSQSAAAGTFAKVCMHDSVCRCGGSGCKHYLLVQHWVNLRVHLPRNGNKRLWDESTSLWSVHTSMYSQSPKTSCVLSLVCKNCFFFFFFFIAEVSSGVPFHVLLYTPLFAAVLSRNTCWFVARSHCSWNMNEGRKRCWICCPCSKSKTLNLL